MVKRLFKKSIACLLTVLMIATSLPLTALADSTTDAGTDAVVSRTVKVSSTAVGIITNDGSSRVSTSGSSADYNIVNDAQDANFSAAFWKYDTSDIKTLTGTTIKEARFDITLTSTAPLNDFQGYTLYYATNESAVNSLSQGNNKGSDLGGIYTGSNHISNMVSKYGLVSVATFDKATVTANVGGTITADVSAAMNYAIQNIKDQVTFFLMQSNAGQSGSSNDWSDSHIIADKPDITCTYDETIEVVPGLDGINNAIKAYENKMAEVSSSKIYKDMSSVYAVYQKAIKYRDAYQYGGRDAPTVDEVTDVANELVTATENMEVWTDDVTGKFKSVVPTYQSNGGTYSVNSSLQMSDGNPYYSNIIYWETCKGTNNDTSDGDKSGMAIQFDDAGDTKVEIYYPNTVLLYDGVTPARMPVMFMARATANKDRYIYQVYPAQTNMSDTQWKDSKAGEDPELKSVAQVTGETVDNWKGGDSSSNSLNKLDFNAARNNGTNYPSAGVSLKVQDNGTVHKSISARLGTSWSFGYKYYWNNYATSFQVTNLNVSASSNQGYKRVGIYWAYYGGSDTTVSETGVDANIKGYKNSKADNSSGSEKKITVINYKGLMDALKAVSFNPLTDVSKYKEGGLADLLTAIDNVTAYATYDKIAGITIDTAQSEGKTITTLMDGLSDAKATEDTGASYYDSLKTAITASKKIYNAGNEDYTKYTQEVWDPFVTAYEAATAYFYALYPDGTLDMSAAQELESNLTTAKNNLKNGMIKKVVETTYLENAIGNAEAIIHNSAYFVSSTIDVATLESIVSSAKAEIWGSEENYGFDTEKIDGTTENQAKVDAYVEQLCAEIKKAQVNVNYVTTSGKSLTTALQAAAVYEDTKANYGNYVVLQTAVNNAENFRDNLPTYDGKVADVVDNSISNYADIVAAVINAINNLQPGFDQLKTGDKASEGKLKKTEFSSSSRSDQWKFYWEYTTDPIIFKTTRDAYTYTFPTSRWGIYNAQTGTDFEMMLDSIKLNSANLQSGEITASSRVQGYGWPTKNYDLSAAQLSDYAAQLAIQSNTRLEITSAKVTKSTGQALGVASALTAAGELDHITDTNHNFVTELEVTDGISGPSRGGIYAKGGWTEFDTTTTLTFPLDQFTLSAKSTPSSMSYDVNYKSGLGTYFGVVYFWKYGYMGGTWAGYGFERAPFEEEVYLVNLTPLFELIKQCTAEDFVATEKQYTTSSWQALLTAIADANSSNENSKSDVKFDYGSMSYDDIITAVDKRYTDLWNAYKNLKKAANNTKIKNAVAAAKSAYENDKSKIKESTWDAFEEAYLNATSVISTGAKYSDEKITDVSSNDQSAVDAYATALTEAFNALVYQIDFTSVDNAVNTLIDSVESNKYSAESVKAVKAGIENLTYYMMSASDRKNHYTDETDVVAAVKKEAEETIPALKSLLKESTVDTSVLEAAKAEGKAKLSDPDAYDQDAVNTALAALTETENVILGTSRIVCKKFATQDECDQAIKDALDGIQLRNYTVKIVPDGDESKATTQTVAYGTQYTASLDGKPTVDWYYEMTSPSTSVAKKFYSTTDELEFIVRGDTTLTTKSASKTAQQYKVTYINGVNSSAVATDYVTAGSTITLGTNSDNQNIVPNLPYYTFDSFKVNGEEKKQGDTITVDKDTTITIVYNFTNEKTYTVRIVNLDGHMGLSNVIDLSGLKYNDELSFKAGTVGEDNTDGYGGYNMNYDVTKYDDTSKAYSTETVTTEGYGRYNNSLIGDTWGNDDVYAWLELASDEMSADTISEWWTKATEINDGYSKLFDAAEEYGSSMYYPFSDYAKANTKARVVKYGQDYTFRVHEDTYLLPVTEKEYKDALAAGMILDDQTDDNGVRIKTQSELVIAQGKASIVSTFALPEDCTLVEKGLLAKVNKDALIDDTSDLKLANAGKNGVNRLKSNYTTAGDQFVISFNTSALNGKNISDVGLAWVAYITYRTADDQLVTQYSPVTTPTNEGTY